MKDQVLTQSRCRGISDFIQVLVHFEHGYGAFAGTTVLDHVEDDIGVVGGRRSAVESFLRGQ